MAHSKLVVTWSVKNYYGFEFMKNTAAIIDFGSLEVVTLVGESGVNNTLNISGRGKVSYAGFHNSEFLEPEYLKDIVKNSISKAETSSGYKISEMREFLKTLGYKYFCTFDKMKPSFHLL